jgi:biotin carboxylase
MTVEGINPESTQRPKVLALHQRTSLGWLFESAAAAGFDIVLVPLEAEKAITSAQLPPCVTDVVQADYATDVEDLVSFLSAVIADHAIDGVIACHEDSVALAARLAEACGLPGISPATADILRDKGTFRSALDDARLNVPRFAAGTSEEDLLPATATLRFPAVVKPVDGYSSAGVIRVDRHELLPAAIATCHEASRPLREQLGNSTQRIVVEEFLDGVELAVESISYAGRTRILATGYKGQPTGPYFEESVYQAPARLDDKILALVHEQVVSAHQRLGIGWGPTHTELRLGPGGQPYILEIGGRVGGSGVSHYIVQASTGVDYFGEVLAAAVGREPAVMSLPEIPARAAAGNYIVQCQGAGVFQGVDGLDGVEADPRVDLVVPTMQRGQVVKPYPEFSGYPGFVLSRHSDMEDLEGFHRHLDDRLKVVFE